MGTIELETLSDDKDIAELKGLIEKHLLNTDSSLAKEILSNWPKELENFIKVIPTDYKRVLESMAQKPNSISA